jgi:hypothetical protein
VKALTKTSSMSAIRIIVDLIESGIEAPGSRKGNASSIWPTAWLGQAMRKSANVSMQSWPA